MEQIKRLILEEIAANRISDERAKTLLTELNSVHKKAESEDIAIVGFSAEMPEAKNTAEFWQNLENGHDSVRPIPAERGASLKEYARIMKPSEKNVRFFERSYLDDIEMFDHRFFKLSPKEASLMDPYQRLLLQNLYHCLEDGGYTGNAISGSNTGVFIGHNSNKSGLYEKLVKQFEPKYTNMAWLPNLTSLIPSRISYILDLHGPAMVIDTACSSSLVAIHVACQSLRNNECDMSLVGAASLDIFPFDDDSENDDVGILSNDGRTRAFDEMSSGTGLGEGVGSILLKPYAKAVKDNDTIHAVIKGSAINQDGKSNGISSPNEVLQEKVIKQAWKNAGIKPEEISYIEAHGTGTKIGDPIEISAINSAFRSFTDKKEFCDVSSVKTNIGHLDNAAGIAGIIKVILSLKHKKLPANVHFKSLNKLINAKNSAVKINAGLKDWVGINDKRIAGISSFGMSGTNCHMVLQEAPESTSDDTNENLFKVFTLSANSANMLHTYAENYIDFLQTSPASLDDICYTMSVRRAHMNHRIVCLAKSTEDLVQKLSSVVNKTYNTEFKTTVFMDSSDREAGDRDIDLKNIDLQVEHYTTDSALNALCKRYIEGKTLNWADLYINSSVKSVSLPLTPFEKDKAWINYRSLSNEKKFPLLDAFHHSENGFHFTTTLSQEHWVLNEHVLMGSPVLPGTALIEMLLESFKRTHDDASISIEKLYFHQPFVLHEKDEKEIYISAQKTVEGFDVTIYSSDTLTSFEQTNFTTHLKAKLTRGESADNQLDLSQLKRRITDVQNLDRTPDDVVQFGKRWDVLKSIHRNDTEVLVELELNEQFQNDLNVYECHPSLLDVAINIGENNSEHYLPFSFDALNYVQPLKSKIYSHLVRKNESEESDEILTYDVTVCDEDGNILLNIKNYALKKVRNVASKHNELIHLDSYKKTWVTYQLPESGAKPNHLILIKNKNDIANNTTAELLELYPGSNVYEIGSENSSEYDELNISIDALKEFVSKLKNEEVTIAFTVGHTTETSFINRYNETIKFLFNLNKAVHLSDRTHAIHLILISDQGFRVIGSEDIVDPFSSSLFNMAEVINKENKGLVCRAVDRDDTSDIRDIFRFDSTTPFLISMRNATAYIYEISSVKLDTRSKLELKENGVYLISGGLGALGLEAAHWISSRVKATLILMSRKTLVSKDDWSEVQKENEHYNIYNKLLEIEALGSNVIPLSVDVSDGSTLAPLINELKEKHGALNGIIHAAGLAGNGILANKEDKIFDNVFLSKAEGAWNLFELIDGTKNLDFFMMYSSVSTLLSPLGQGDYVAANAFLNALSTHMNQKGIPSISINWPAWNEAGMAIDNDALTDGDIFYSINNHKGIQYLDHIMSERTDELIVGEINTDSLSQHIDYLPVKLSQVLLNKLKLNKRENNVQSETEKQGNYRITEDESKLNENLKKVAYIWCEVLGMDEISIHDNFFELGGDSIIAIEINTMVSETFAIDFPLNKIFSHPTIFELNEAIESMAKKTKVQFKKRERRVIV